MSVNFLIVWVYFYLSQITLQWRMYPLRLEARRQVAMTVAVGDHPAWVSTGHRGSAVNKLCHFHDPKKRAHVTSTWEGKGLFDVKFLLRRKN